MLDPRVIVDIAPHLTAGGYVASVEGWRCTTAHTDARWAIAEALDLVQSGDLAWQLCEFLHRTSTVFDHETRPQVLCEAYRLSRHAQRVLQCLSLYPYESDLAELISSYVGGDAPVDL